MWSIECEYLKEVVFWEPYFNFSRILFLEILYFKTQYFLRDPNHNLLTEFLRKYLAIADNIIYF